ncbi:MAG TPA: signal recognition particle-docking protein FtsY [Gammaproteobacteria bacterium]|nr:signal recognition particle-docking protein FtsY [Gammaproteobacteria bacterium]
MATDSNASSNSGFFTKLRQRLNRGKSWLGADIGGLLGRKLDTEALEELEERLLLADVGVEATQWVVEAMQKRARSSDGDANTLLRDTVAELLSPLYEPLAIDPAARPFVILVVGVNGAGKTTSIAKLASRLRAAGLEVLLAAGDTFRAAAVEQLQEWGRRIDVPVIAQAPGADPAAVVHDALEAARSRGVDVVIADTAGRLHTAAGLMDELAKIRRIVARFDPAAPHETLLVLDASQGQNALAQAREFHAQAGVTGLVLTKLDGTAKGGIALAIARTLPVPVRFISLGEGFEDFGEFEPGEFATALTGAQPA